MSDRPNAADAWLLNALGFDVNAGAPNGRAQGPMRDLAEDAMLARMPPPNQPAQAQQPPIPAQARTRGDAPSGQARQPMRDLAEDAMLANMPPPNQPQRAAPRRGRDAKQPVAAQDANAGPQPLTGDPVQDRPAVAANLHRTLEGPSTSHPSRPLWAEPTRGAISPERRASVDAILSAQPDEAFNEREAAKRKDTAKALAADPLVQKAHKEWPDWAADPEKHKDDIEKFVRQVIGKQSELNGLKGKEPTIKFEKSELSASTNGSYDVGSQTLSISRVHPDFKEMLNTLTHENTHAFQDSLVQQLQAGAITPKHPDYMAATAMQMNREHGYISPELSKQYDPENHERAYKEQCSEKHAFAAGDEIAAMINDELDKALPPEIREKNQQRTADACFELAKLQEADEAERDKEDLREHIEELKAAAEQQARAMEEQRQHAEQERAKLAAEAEELQRQQHGEAEDARLNREMAEMRKMMAQMQGLDAAELEKNELMEQHGMSEMDVALFQAMKADDPELEPDYFMKMRRRQQS
jgi:hypothetical protein